MRPRERRETGEQDLFRSRLDQIIDMDHALTKLARMVDWAFLERRFGEVYTDDPGHPPLPTRLMAGPAILFVSDRCGAGSKRYGIAGYEHRLDHATRAVHFPAKTIRTKGLPIGVQVIGASFSDASTLWYAKWIDSAVTATTGAPYP